MRLGVDMNRATATDAKFTDATDTDCNLYIFSIGREFRDLKFHRMREFLLPYL